MANESSFDGINLKLAARHCCQMVVSVVKKVFLLYFSGADFFKCEINNAFRNGQILSIIADILCFGCTSRVDA
jgi:hypothetical protein